MQVVVSEVVSAKELRQFSLWSVYASFCVCVFFLKKKKQALNYVVAIGSHLMIELIQVQGRLDTCWKCL